MHEAIKAALDGRRFWVGRDEMEFRVGFYSNGRTGIDIVSVGRIGGSDPDGPYPGETWGSLTVNLDDDPLGPGEVFVKLPQRYDFSSSKIIRAVESLGLFDRTGRFANSGFVTDYAEAWRWKQPSASYLAELDARHERGRL